MKNYKTIIFDLDDTLIDNHESIKYAFKKVIELLNVEYSDELLELWKCHDIGYWHNWESGLLIVPDYINNLNDKITYLRAKRFMMFFKSLRLSYMDAVKLNKVYCNFLGFNIIEINGANDLLSSIKYDYEIVVATNGPRNAALDKIKKAKLHNNISLLVSSEEVGYSKPNKIFFDYMIDKCQNKDKKKMLLVGDSLSTDILGGMNNNIDTCLYNPNDIIIPDNYKPNITINKLKELKKIL